MQKVLQNLSFTCALTKPDGKTETKELKLNTDGLVWNAENNAYEYTFTNLTPGTTYKVNENDAVPDGYDLTVSPDTKEISRGRLQEVQHRKQNSSTGISGVTAY